MPAERVAARLGVLGLRSIDLEKMEGARLYHFLYMLSATE
jgi:hypothetical protein